MAQGLVIGTAGHIDHGKTSLVRALTGMDTDRLAEEKRRGISIDLGFAHLTLPNGAQVSFVDVPGHERFIRNMLAGAAGIEAVLLVIAADESVKPQTREHFDICHLLAIRRGLIVLTKCDLATPTQLAQTINDARHLTADSFLDGAPVVQVSSFTGAGLPELIKQLALLANQTSARDARALPRLPIDRSFALKGFGTVVTGTLGSGRLRVGDTVRIHPVDREARIRGLQRHGHAVDTAVAGDRTAVNLAGIEHADIKRGFVLSSLNALETTNLFDATLHWLDPSFAPSRSAQFLLDVGTAEIPVTVKSLRAGEPYARVQSAEPVLVLPEDRFILRRPSPPLTVAGGLVMDTFPLKRRNKAKTLDRLNRMAAASLSQRLEILIDDSPSGLPIEQAVRFTGKPLEQIAAQSPNLIVVAGHHLISKSWIGQKRQKVLEWLRTFHTEHPTAVGAPIAQARLGLTIELAAPLFENFAGVEVRDGLVSLSEHKPQPANLDTQSLARMESAFRQAAFQPPTPEEAMKAVAMDPKAARSLLEMLVKNGRLVRISADMIFHADVLLHLRQSLAAHKGRRFSVPEFKSWINISRKHAIPLLEYLDRQRITKREGDFRQVI